MLFGLSFNWTECSMKSLDHIISQYYIDIIFFKTETILFRFGFRTVYLLMVHPIVVESLFVILWSFFILWYLFKFCW